MRALPSTCGMIFKRKFGAESVALIAARSIADLVETEHHDFEQQRLFAVEVVVEAGLGQSERPGDVAHRGGVEAAIAEELGDRPKHLRATGIRCRGGCALTSHDVKGAIIGPRRTDRSVGAGIQASLPIANLAYEDLEWWIEVQAENSRNHRFTAARLLQNEANPQ